MTAAERFVPEGDAAAARREKAIARELRQTGWWKRRIADGRCHYCRRNVGARGLTLDHVVPLSRGGLSTWDNVVCACIPGNSRKGNRMLHTSGMQLIRMPKRQHGHVMARSQTRTQLK